MPLTPESGFTTGIIHSGSVLSWSDGHFPYCFLPLTVLHLQVEAHTVLSLMGITKCRKDERGSSAFESFVSGCTLRLQMHKAR